MGPLHADAHLPFKHEVSRRGALKSRAARAALAAAPAGVGAATPAPADAGAWDLTALYADAAAWERARQAVLGALPGLARYRGTLGTGAGVLEAAYAAASDLARAARRLDTYAHLQADADLRDAGAQERRQLAVDLLSQLGAATGWMTPEVAALGPQAVDRFVAARPGLARFRLALTDAQRRAAHTLPGEAEAVLAAAATPLAGPAAIQRQLVAAVPRSDVTLSTGQTVRADDRVFATWSRAPNRADRQRVSDAYWAGFRTLEGALGETLAASVEGDVFTARARRHASALDAALFELNLPAAVYPTMLAEVARGLPVLHRYYALRRRALELPELRDYDLTVPLAALDRTFGLAEIRDLTLAAVRPLGRPYVDRLARATAARWMDPFSRPGKAGGGYCDAGAYDVHPYVLLNVAPTAAPYAGATAFAHEWGHAMHAVLAYAAQPFDTCNAPPFVQEVASTCHEQLLLAHMVRTARGPRERLFYLGQQLDTFAFVFFRQALRAEFEARTHARVEGGQALSGEQLTQLYHELLARDYGPGVVTDPAYALEWARQAQYYDAFYVFQYVTAITGGVHFARAVLDGSAAERDRYLALLAAGGSDSGYALLRDAGLDLASPAPYRAVVGAFAATLDEAEAALA